MFLDSYRNYRSGNRNGLRTSYRSHFSYGSVQRENFDYEPVDSKETSETSNFVFWLVFLTFIILSVVVFWGIFLQTPLDHFQSNTLNAGLGETLTQQDILLVTPSPEDLTAGTPIPSKTVPETTVAPLPSPEKVTPETTAAAAPVVVETTAEVASSTTSKAHTAEANVAGCMQLKCMSFVKGNNTKPAASNTTTTTSIQPTTDVSGSNSMDDAMKCFNEFGANSSEACFAKAANGTNPSINNMYMCGKCNCYDAAKKPNDTVCAKYKNSGWADNIPAKYVGGPKVNGTTMKPQDYYRKAFLPKKPTKTDKKSKDDVKANTSDNNYSGYYSKYLDFGKSSNPSQGADPSGGQIKAHAPGSAMAEIPKY